MNLKFLLLAALCYCPLIAQIKAECIIETPQDSAIRPLFFKNFNTATKLIPHENKSFVLDSGESIIGYCTNSFKERSESQVTIKCRSDGIIVEPQHYYMSYNPAKMFFECHRGGASKTCNMQLPSDKAVRPKILKKIGTRSIHISPGMERISIKHNQKITAHCDTKLTIHGTQELDLICIGSRIVALDQPYSGIYDNLECELSKWNLYESKRPFSWCPTSMASYHLARPVANNGYEYLAGLCYDFDHMALKSLYYAAKPKFSQNLTPRILEDFEPLMEIPEINETFFSERTYLYENPKIQKWISFSNYKNDSIVQYRRLHTDLFQQFDQLLNIDWWSGLKLGNWELYQEAFAKHIENGNNEYDILAGVSKEVAVPIRKENCNKNITLVKVIDSENNRLPLYVWNYLRSVKNSSDDVVIIGVNTPFADFYNENELLFCNDICHTIDWLKDVHMSFRYRPMGIIFCCAYNEVMASMRLDGFAEPQTPISSSTLRAIFNYDAYFANTTTTTAKTIESEGYYSTEREPEFYEPTESEEY